MTFDEVLQEALALPAEARAQLAAALLRSFEPDDGEVLAEAEWNEAWAAEPNRRAREIEEGRAQTIPADEVFTELRARFPPP
jgi:putative addiction module component (TIGR02574 family)